MNCFTLTAVGHLARNPEVILKDGVSYTRFCLIGNDYAGKDDEGAAREIITSVWLTAFGPLGDSIARHARKGDQLVVDARVRSSNWTDKQGEKRYDYSFVVEGFKFGAPGKVKREEFNGRRDQTLSLPRPEDRGNGHELDAGHPFNGEGGENYDARPGDAHDKDVGGDQEGPEPEGAGSSPASSVTSAPVTAKGSQEKTRGSRPTRKSAVSVA
jgi:single-strand DNA-binding protein